MSVSLAAKIKSYNISVSDVITRGADSYHGFALKNGSAVTATVTVYDGESASGTILDVINLVEGESASDWYNDGVYLETDSVYVEITGVVIGGIRIR